jgi:hypothetical protein
VFSWGHLRAGCERVVSWGILTHRYAQFQTAAPESRLQSIELAKHELRRMSPSLRLSTLSAPSLRSVPGTRTRAPNRSAGIVSCLSMQIVPLRASIAERSFSSACSPSTREASGNRGSFDSLAPVRGLGRWNQRLWASIRRHQSRLGRGRFGDQTDARRRKCRIRVPPESGPTGTH